MVLEISKRFGCKKLTRKSVKIVSRVPSDCVRVIGVKKKNESSYTYNFIMIEDIWLLLRPLSLYDSFGLYLTFVFSERAKITFWLSRVISKIYKYRLVDSKYIVWLSFLSSRTFKTDVTYFFTLETNMPYSEFKTIFYSYFLYIEDLGKCSSEFKN